MTEPVRLPAGSKTGSARLDLDGRVVVVSGISGWVTGQVLIVDGGSSVRPSFLGIDNLPVFVHNEAMRARLTSGLDT